MNKPRTNVAEKLAIIRGETGMTDEELMNQGVMDGVCWGICKKEGCNYTIEVEPDQTHGWCESCKSQTVQSVLIMFGII